MILVKSEHGFHFLWPDREVTRSGGSFPILFRDPFSAPAKPALGLEKTDGLRN